MDKFVLINMNLDADIRRTEEALADFAKQLEQNPLYAMEWGDNAVEAAAKQKALKAIKAEVGKLLGSDDREVDGHLVVTLLDREAADKARRGLTSGSTSEMSNVAARALGAGWMEVWNDGYRALIVKACGIEGAL